MMNNSPYLPEAPIYEELVNEENKMTDTWVNHLDAISQTFGYIVAHDRFNDTKNETAVNIVIAMEEARRDQLQNAPNGMILYNLTTNRFNFRQNGAWVTFPAVPA